MYLIITECCKRKCESELFEHSLDFLSRLDSESRSILLRGRKLFSKSIHGKIEVTALSLYNGHLYRELDKVLTYRSILNNELDFIIISAAYGITHALEKIRNYELHMNSRVNSEKVIDLWIKLNLPKVIAKYIEHNHYEKVLIFTSKTSRYMKIIKYSLHMLSKDSLEKVYIITSKSSSGVRSLRILGKTLNLFITSKDFSKLLEFKDVKIHQVRR